MTNKYYFFHKQAALLTDACAFTKELLDSSGHNTPDKYMILSSAIEKCWTHLTTSGSLSMLPISDISRRSPLLQFVKTPYYTQIRTNKKPDLHIVNQAF